MGHSKQLAIKNLLKKANPDRALIPETKREEIASCIIKALWINISCRLLKFGQEKECHYNVAYKLFQH